MKYCPLCENDYPDDVTVCPLDGGTVRRPGTRSDPLIGRVIRGRYRVERQLGEGGMGTVYLAEQLSIGRKVALKVLRGDFARDDSFVARFRQEAKLVAVLNDTHNPHVTLVHDFDQAEDGSAFIVMEWLEGRPLNEVIKREGALGLSRAVRLATQIAQGLEAAHRAGVIHRDIKPHNIMVLDANDNIKLMDFGIARLRDSTQTPLTRVGTMMGTPDYMAPEQIEGQEVTDRTDIYSFGIVFYEMLTGVVPFRANTPAAVLTKQLREEPTPPARLRPDVPRDIEELVLRALMKDPQQRQRDMGEIAAALSRMSRALTDAPAGPAAPVTRTVIGVASPSSAATIAMPTPARPSGLSPAPTSAATRWTVAESTPAEPPPGPPPRAASDTWFSETPGSSGTVIVDPTDDADRPRPVSAPGPSRSRRTLVVAGAVTAAVVIVGSLSTWMYLGSSSDRRQSSTTSVSTGVPLPSGSGTTLPAGPERVVSVNEGASKPVVLPPTEPPPREVVTPQPGVDVKPPRIESTPPVDPRTEGSPRPRPPRPSEARDRPPRPSPTGDTKTSPPPIVTSKPAPAPPSADLLRTQVEDRLRGRGLLRGSGSDADTGVTVEINSDRIVILRGIVRDPEQRDEAIQLARVAGVVEVRPRINVQRSWN